MNKNILKSFLQNHTTIRKRNSKLLYNRVRLTYSKVKSRKLIENDEIRLKLKRKTVKTT